MSDIVNTFKETLTSETSKELIANSADITFANFLESDMIDKIPIFGLLNSGIKLVCDYRNFRFAKKIYKFLFDTKDIPIHKRVEFAVDYGNANQENGYEILLSVIDRLDNINKIDIMANLVNHRVYNHITIEEFIRLTTALERIPYPDITKLFNYTTDCYEPGGGDRYVKCCWFIV